MLLLEKLPMLLISSGLQEKENGGTGFNIYFKSGFIAVAVQTNEEQYNLTHFVYSRSALRTYVITWEKGAGLKLFINGNLAAEVNSPRLMNTSILQLKQAYFQIRSAHYAGPQLPVYVYSIQTWRNAWTSREVKEMYKIRCK